VRSGTGEVLGWSETGTATPLAMFRTLGGLPVAALAFAPDGATFTAVTNDGDRSLSDTYQLHGLVAAGGGAPRLVPLSADGPLSRSQRLDLFDYAKLGARVRFASDAAVLSAAITASPAAESCATLGLHELAGTVTRIVKKEEVEQYDSDDDWAPERLVHVPKLTVELPGRTRSLPLDAIVCYSRPAPPNQPCCPTLLRAHADGAEARARVGGELVAASAFARAELRVAVEPSRVRARVGRPPSSCPTISTRTTSG
jgi:hypothetical protein